MQTTLLGIAIALILALVAALVGPSFVNWNAHRAFFESEATKLVGLPVHVSGAIDVSMLPTPSITLRGITVGDKGEASRLRAGALAIELGLGPLMRGEFRAAEMRLISPEIKLGVDRNGTVDMPSMAIGLDSERLSIDHLTVEGGRAILTDESTGARVTLEKLWFRGEVRSIRGPYRGEGGFAGTDSFYRFRVSTSQLAGDGLKLKLALDVVDKWFTVEAEGGLSFDYGSPRFDGNLTVSRPAGAELASGKAAVNEPWRGTTKVQASPTGIMFDQIDFQYGPDERGMKIGGRAEIRLGEQPRLQGVFSARNLDLDRLAAKPNAQRPLPLAAVKSLAETFGNVSKLGLPARFSFNVDTAMLGGAMVQAISGDVSSQGSGWTLERLELRAPGFTHVRTDGRLETTAQGPGYSGKVKVTAADATALFGWLSGRRNATPGVLKSWRFESNVALSNERIALEQMRTEFDGAWMQGNVAYAVASGSKPASMKAELNATEFDVDTWILLSNSMFKGLLPDAPTDVALALDVDKARIAGVETRKASISLAFDKNTFDLKRLSVDGLGDASFEASGRIDTQGSSPRGNIKLDLDARDLTILISLAEKFVPTAVGPLKRLSGRQPTAKLHAVVGLDTSASGKRVTGRVAIDGQIGTFRISAAGGASSEVSSMSIADLSALAAGDLRFEGQLDAEDGGALVALVGLDRLLATEGKPGRLRVVASGPLNRDIRIDCRLTTSPIDFNAVGDANLFAKQPSVNLNRFTGAIGTNKVQGKLFVGFGAPLRLDGNIEVDRIDVPAAFAMLVGLPVEKIRVGDTWSLEPFAAVTSAYSGRIDIKTGRAQLGQKFTAQALRGALQFSDSKVSFEVYSSEVAGGKMVGEVAFFSSPEGLSTLSYFDLSGAKAAQVIPSAGKPPITGTMSLQATVEGSGLTPAAFVGSLRGNGRITIEDGEFAGLNPNVFNALTQAVDFGIQADTRQIRDFVSIMLDRGRLSVPRADSKFSIVGAQLKLIEPKVEVKGAELAVAATVNLGNGTCDATLTLSGEPAGDVAGRPAVSVALKGDFSSPRHTINSDSLAGWLALRSADKQAKRLETIEATRRAAPAQPQADSTTFGAGETPPGGDNDAGGGRNQPSADDATATTTEPATGIIGTNRIPPLAPPVVIQSDSNSFRPFAPGR